MGTVIDRIDVSRAGWRARHSALHLAVAAAKDLPAGGRTRRPPTSTCWSTPESTATATSENPPSLP